MELIGASPAHAISLTVTADRIRAHLMELPEQIAARSAPEPGLVPRGLVDLREAAPGLVVLPAPAWSNAHLRHLARPEVAQRLQIVAESLPSDLRLGLWEGLRPLSVQRALWHSGLLFLRSLHPDVALPQLESALEQFVAHPGGSHPPHSTGSAVDIAPVDAFGRVMAPVDSWGRLAVETTSRALRGAGLANYTLEWWHWSYGDEEWARANDCAPKTFAVQPEFDGPGGGI